MFNFVHISIFLEVSWHPALHVHKPREIVQCLARNGPISLGVKRDGFSTGNCNRRCVEYVSSNSVGGQEKQRGRKANGQFTVTSS